MGQYPNVFLEIPIDSPNGIPKGKLLAFYLESQRYTFMVASGTTKGKPQVFALGFRRENLWEYPELPL